MNHTQTKTNKRKERKTMKTKRILALVIAVITILSMCAISTSAAVNPYNIDFNAKGSIEFWKYEMEDDDINNATVRGDGTLKGLPEGAKPLENVEFTLYQIYTKDETKKKFFLTDGAELPSPSEAEPLARAVTDAGRIKKQTTNHQGHIKFENLELGIYFVEETFSPSQVRQKTASFVVAVPSTNAQGTQWLYDLTVQPKNQTKYTSVTLHKTAVSSDTTKNGKDLAGFKFSLEEKITTKNSQTGVTTNTWTPVATTGSTGTTGGTAPKAATWTTGANGKFTIDHLATAREFRFKELSATDKQYIVDSTVYYYFRTNEDGTINYAGRVTPGDAINYPSATVKNNEIGVTNETPEVHKSVSVDQIYERDEQGNIIKDGAGRPTFITMASPDKRTWHQDVTQDMNDLVFWRISADIPEIVTKLSTYKITDTLSKGLTYKTKDNKNIDIYVEIDGAAIAKDAYTVDTVKNASTGETVITINITRLSVLAGHSVCDIIYATTINENAIIGGDNPNKAKLTYTNDINTASTFDKTTETPEVHTGGYTIWKTDENNQALATAEFSVYRSQADADSNADPIEFIKIGNTYYVADTADAYKATDGVRTTTLVSGTDGYIKMVGFKYGSDDMKSNEGSTDYWMAETKAPAGKNLLQKPFSITVTATTHNYKAGTNVQVVNTPQAEFPLTGSQMALIISGAGVFVIAIGLSVLFIKRRKKTTK